MDIKGLVKRAKTELSELTGLKPVTVTGASKDDKGWHITLDMLVMTRIPPATDILADYDVLLDDDGNMIKFERKRIRLRGDPLENE
ncbi:MAG: gas vesicle protein GvpO [Dehalococcoidia bacterium]|nr:gas vesicle protein GvpO [Dehalococcoidia bacterium]